MGTSVRSRLTVPGDRASARGLPPQGSGEQRRQGGRGAIDHFAIAVDSRDELEAVKQRLIDAGADIGEIQQLGPEWSLFFRDVDGMELEVCAPAD
jgi:catechol 2,3-dioxygenase-like lactoylglutathione lyase family enzyme